MKIIKVLIGCFTLMPSCSYAQRWVDMGIRAENGDVIYWSNSDLRIRKNGTLTFADYGEMGSVFGWGDVTGQATGNDLSNFGGTNPPNSIEGNPQYDIITAKLGKEYRLPTVDDFKKLEENCTVTLTTIERSNNVGKDGLPSWVQGQWMWHSAALVNGRVMNVSNTLKIDGFLASVYTSDNDYWEGSYTYSNGRLKVWELDLIIDESNKTIKDDRGYQYQKISDKVESRKITGYIYTSKINGKSLFLVLPPKISTATLGGGQYTMVWDNPQVAEYWTGTLYEENKDKAVEYLISYKERSMYSDLRSNQKRMRAIKVDFGSGARLAEEKRIAEQKAAEEKAMREELKRQRLEELRVEAYANSPMIKALSVLEDKNNFSGIFDYKMYALDYYRTGIREIILVLYSNEKTNDLYKKFWNSLLDGEDKDTYKRFWGEKLKESLTNILESISEFSVKDSEGQLYRFKYSERITEAPYELGYNAEGNLNFRVYSANYGKRADFYPILDGKEDHRLLVKNVNLGLFPFIRKEHSKGSILYCIKFSLPYSSDYTLIANGKKIKSKNIKNNNDERTILRPIMDKLKNSLKTVR